MKLVIDEVGYEEIKVKYYKMMIEYYTSERNVWEICQSYYKIFDTTTTKEDESFARNSLESCIVYLFLSKHDKQQNDFLEVYYIFLLVLLYI